MSNIPFLNGNKEWLRVIIGALCSYFAFTIVLYIFSASFLAAFIYFFTIGSFWTMGTFPPIGLLAVGLSTIAGTVTGLIILKILKIPSTLPIAVISSILILGAINLQVGLIEKYSNINLAEGPTLADVNSYLNYFLLPVFLVSYLGIYFISKIFLNRPWLLTLLLIPLSSALSYFLYLQGTPLQDSAYEASSVKWQDKQNVLYDKKAADAGINLFAPAYIPKGYSLYQYFVFANPFYASIDYRTKITSDPPIEMFISAKESYYNPPQNCGDYLPSSKPNLDIQPCQLLATLDNGSKLYVTNGPNPAYKSYYVLIGNAEITDGGVEIGPVLTDNEMIKVFNSLKVVKSSEIK